MRSARLALRGRAARRWRRPLSRRRGRRRGGAKHRAHHLLVAADALVALRAGQPATWWVVRQTAGFLKA